MTTFTYNSVGLSVKDRLTINNLLGLFEGRLNAKWVSVTPAQNKGPHLQLLDVDQPEGLQLWEGPNPPTGRVAVTANDRWPGEPFISRPIRAYGPNGVIVLFNSIAQGLSSRSRDNAPDLKREPERIRMTGRLEVPAASLTSAPLPVTAVPATPVSAAQLSAVPVRATRPPWSVTARPHISRSVVQPTLPAPVADAPPRTRVAVRWGPPETVILPPLTRMPGARIHWVGDSSPEHDNVEIPLPAPSIHTATSAVTETHVPVEHSAPTAPPPKSWSAPKQIEASALTEMPIAHRPVEIYAPSAPVIGRARLEVFTDTTPIVDETPVLRPAPRQWKSPEPETVKQLVDFRMWQDASLVAPIEAASVQEVAEVPAAEPPIVVVEPDGLEHVSDVHIAPLHAAAEPVVESHATKENVAAETGIELKEIHTGEEEEIQALFNDVQQNLETLSQAITSEAYPEELPVIDAEADWWGTADNPESPADQQTETPEGSHLVAALKAIKASGQPSILEIAGLPAVCVIPARNIYFTTAPAARLETAIGASSDVTWRGCASETEARQLSGTEQSRQASLEQLSWTAALLAPPADPQSIADRAVRLKRWPPITESRGRSKFLRYATILSGALATPRELAEITGDSVEEIVSFVNACSQMNLLETSGGPQTSLAVPPTRSGGAGILRDMIEQLTPPKI